MVVTPPRTNSRWWQRGRCWPTPQELPSSMQDRYGEGRRLDEGLRQDKYNNMFSAQILALGTVVVKTNACTEAKNKFKVPFQVNQVFITDEQIWFYAMFY